MAERLLLVCDVCGAPATETVTFKTSSGNRQKDYCAADLQKLLSGSRAPKRGRKPGSARAATGGTSKSSTTSRSAKNSGGPRKAVTRKTTASRAGYSKNGKRLGRPPAPGRKKPGRRKMKAPA